MIDHPFKPHEVWTTRDQCEHRLDEEKDGAYGICAAPRSEHMDEVRVLKVQLATALRERDEAREQADHKKCGQGLVRLQEAIAAANARADAQMATVLHTIGGKVEGHPTSALNYLQRLRALVAIEKAFVDAGPMVASAKYMIEKARNCERAEEALAAARRECDLAGSERNRLRGALQDIADLCMARDDDFKRCDQSAHRIARAAIAAPAAGDSK